VQPSFVEQNKANIRRVMDAIREKPIDGMLYSSFTLEDGNTFVHINMARDDETMSRLREVPEFQQFQAALRDSKPPVPPKATDLHAVGAAFVL
jgi:hypothetical protein